MKILVKDLIPNMMGIYKINFPNGKCYIGLSCDIKRRMFEHNTPSENKTPCDKAINYYGKITEIEILEFVNDKNFLEERERYWISFYHSNNKEIGYNLTDGGDGTGHYGEKSPRAVFTNDEVLDIRKRRFNGEKRRDVYKDYKNHPINSFDGVWLGRGYPDIGKEYLIPHNPEYNKKYYSSLANSGTGSGRSKLTKEDVLNIRKLAEQDNIPVLEILKLYPKVSENTIRRVIKYETYKNI